MMTSGVLSLEGMEALEGGAKARSSVREQEEVRHQTLSQVGGSGRRIGEGLLHWKKAKEIREGRLLRRNSLVGLGPV
jgi:hypothetical protein